MSVLQPKIDDGTIKIVSGETDFNKVTTLRWDAGVAKKRMENLLTKSYSDKDVNGVLAPYDGISRGIIAALKANGYGKDKDMPIVTGQDAELESVKMILSGEQYSTIFKDTRELAKATAAMVQEVLGGGKVTVNDEKTYDNGIKVVPTHAAAAGLRRQGQHRRRPVQGGVLHRSRDEGLTFISLQPW